MDWKRCGISENGGLNTGKALASAHENPIRNDPNLPEHSLLFLNSLPLKSTKSHLIIKQAAQLTLQTKDFSHYSI